MGMEVRQRLELTLGEGGVNADSRVELQLKLLTPLKPHSVNENPDFALQAGARANGEGAFAPSPLESLDFAVTAG
jgi:hypothetical protein